MKKRLLVLLGIVVLATAGSVMAQTEPAPTDQPAAAAPASPEPSAPATDTANQPAAAAVQPAAEPSAAPPAAADTLPATASNSPLIMLIGIVSLGAFTSLLIYRRRRPAQS